ncbi:hypothetical protein [Cyclobacterium marinum]|uniref:hypothetical protein n=1 Tax=Cyclobacterium marinum TaxID=104 RepID=UPI0011ED34D6|nr:hypothetical protein [Cyclobacterium marinum]MBI0398020.1 hypothetical protein [Cyclobacterium marinum]
MDVEIVLSIVIAVCTFIYTGISLLLWVESKASRLQKLTPHVILYLKGTEDHKTLVLHVKNIGEGVAYNVQIKTLENFNQFGLENAPISQLGILKEGFSAMPPGYELKFYIGDLIELYEKSRDRKIKFEVMCKRKDKKNISEVFTLPLIQAMGQNYSTPPETYLGQIPYYLKEINSSLKTIFGNKS